MSGTSVLVTVLVVGIGSVAFRLLPLLGASRIPDRLTQVAGWAGLSVLASLTVRAVLHHEDAAVPGARVAAAVAVAACLMIAFRGRSLLVSVAAGAATYLAIAGVAQLL